MRDTILQHKSRSHLGSCGVQPSQTWERYGTIIKWSADSSPASKLLLRDSEKMNSVQVPAPSQAIIRQFSPKETLIRQRQQGR